MTERLFNNDMTPLMVAFGCETGSAEPGDGRAEEAVGDGKIKQAVAGRTGRLIQSDQMLIQLAISVRIVDIARQITHPLGKPLPCSLNEFVEMKLAIPGDISFHGIGEVRAPLLRAHVGQVDADKTELFGQLAVVRQVVECRDDQTLRQVARGAKDHYRAGRRRGRTRRLSRNSGLGMAIWPV